MAVNTPYGVALNPAEQAELARLQQETAAMNAQYEATRGRTGGELASDVGLGLLQGAVDLGQAAYGLGNVATLGLLDRGIGFSDNFAQTRQILDAARSAPLQRDRARVQEAFQQGVGTGLGELVTTPSVLGDYATAALPSLLPTGAAAGQVARVAAAAGAPRAEIARRATGAGLRAAGLQSAGATNIDAVQAIEEAGGSENLQQLGGLGAAGIAGLGTYGLGRLTGAGALEAAAAARLAGIPVLAEGAGGIARGVVSGALREGTEETLQSALEQASSNLFAPGVGVGTGVGEAAAVGGVLGSLLGGGLGGYTSLRQPSQTRDQLDQASADAAAELGVQPHGTLSGLPVMGVEEIDAAIDLSQTPLPTAGPETLEDLAIRLSQESGPLPTMGVEELATAAPGTPAFVDEITLGLPGAEATPLPTVDVQEIGSTPQGPQWWNTREGRDLFGDPLELAAFRQQVAEPETVPEVSPNQMAMQLEPDSPLQAAIAAQVGLEPNMAGYQPIEYLEGQLLPPEFRALPNPLNRGAGADPLGLPPGTPTLDPRTVFVNTLGQAARAEDYVQAGGRDLFGAPAAPPQTETSSEPAPPPQVTPAEQQSLGLGGIPASETRGWKQFLAKDLGLKASQLSGRDWQRFAEAAVGAGITPESPDAGAFLSTIAAELGADPATASAFAAELATKYAPQVAEPTAPPTPEVVQAEAATAPAEAVAQPNPVEPPAPEPATPAQDSRASMVINRRAAELDDTGQPLGTVRAIEDLLADGSDLDSIEQDWQAVLATPEFQSLPRAEQDALAQYYSDLYDGIANSRYFRTGKEAVDGQSMDVAAFEAQVAAFNARRATQGRPPVQTHDTVAAFRAATGVAAPSDAAGVYLTDGSLHVIRQNTESASELAHTLLHEQGHEGLRGLLGNRVSAVTNRLWANPTLRKRIQKRAQAENLSRAVAGEEVLVDMLAGNERLANDVWSKMRAAVKMTAARLFGVGDLYVADTSVDALLRDAARAIRGETPVGSALDTDQRWATLDKMLTSPQALETDALFSRATTQFSDAVLAGLDRTGMPESLENPIRDGVKTAAKMLQKVAGAASGVSHYDFMPLDQMAKVFAPRFDVDVGNGQTYNALNNLLRAKSDKAASVIQTISKDRPLTYRGPGEATETFTTSPRAVQDAWVEFQRNSPEAAQALDYVNQHGTYYLIHPDRTWEQQAEIDYQQHGFTEAERRAEFDRIRQQWRRMGKTGQQLFKQAQAVYSDLLNQRFDAAVQAIEATGASGAAANVRRSVAEAMQKIRQGPYSPLSRHGDYLVTVRDGEGKVVHFSAYDTPREAADARAEVQKSVTASQRDAGYTVNQTERRDFVPQLDGINYSVLQALENQALQALPASPDADVEAFRKSVRDTLVEVYLQSRPQHSLLNHANARRGVQGFSLDSLRGFSAYGSKAARNIASITHDGEISRHLQGLTEAERVASGANNLYVVRDGQGNPVRYAGYRTLEEAEAAAAGAVSALSEAQQSQGYTVDVVPGTAAPVTDTSSIAAATNTVRRQHAAYEAAVRIRNPMAETISQAGFLFYMSSPSHMFINATQTALVTFPQMAVKYGPARSIKALGSAFKEYFASGTDLLGTNSVVDPAVQEILRSVQERGDFDHTLANALTGIAEGDTGDMVAARSTMMKVASYAMHKSEVFNRQITARAAIDLELQQMQQRGENTRALTDAQKAHLADVADAVVKDSHGNYDAYNKPANMQGPWRKLFLQFQTYRLFMLSMMGRELNTAFRGNPEQKKVARETLAWLLGSQLALTGAVGTVVSPFVFALADLFRDEDELLDSRTAFTMAAPRVLSHGLLSGLIDPRRFSADGLVPIIGDTFAPRDATPAETFEHHLIANLGPWIGLGSGIYQGLNAAFNGDAKTAWRKLTPKPVGDVVSTVFWDSQGVADARGIVYHDPSWWTTALGALGLRSGARAEAEDLRGASFQAEKHVNAVKLRYMNQLKLGTALNDAGMVDEAMQNITEFGRKYPDLAVSARSIRSAIRGRERAQQVASEYGITSGRTPAPSILRALNLSE